MLASDDLRISMFPEPALTASSNVKTRFAKGLTLVASSTGEVLNRSGAVVSVMSAVASSLCTGADGMFCGARSGMRHATPCARSFHHRTYQLDGSQYQATEIPLSTLISARAPVPAPPEAARVSVPLRAR